MLQLTSPLPSSTLASTNFGLGKIVSVQSSDSTSDSPNLSVIFEKIIIQTLISGNIGCVGLRFYPGIKDDKLVMIAGAVNNNNDDMSDGANFCATGFAEGGARISSIDESRAIILANDANETETLGQLKVLQNVNNSNRVFKAFFDNNFLNSLLENSEQLKVEVAEITFDDAVVNRTMVVTVPSSDEINASLLPCPPNCGGGDYLTNL